MNKWLWKVWRQGLRPGSPEAYLFAILCVGIATTVRAAFGLLEQDIIPFATYFPAVLFATLIGGLEAGALAIVLSALIGWYVFVPSYISTHAPDASAFFSGIIFLATATIILWGANGYRQLLRRLDEEEHFRNLAIEELGHRLKNKLASVYAIMGHELREQKETWDRVEGRLRALAAADELIFKSGDERADMREVLSLGITPYDAARVSLVGDDLSLPERLATVVALLVHELVTNAVKYGALSNGQGGVTVSWRAANGRVEMDWIESGGPIVRSPIHRGFGAALLERALEPFQGYTELQFDVDGLKCRLSFALTIGVTERPQPMARPRRFQWPRMKSARQRGGGPVLLDAGVLA
ncbi:MAG: sensor histidine kinase [Alphaproteobacteria bacterium]